MVSTAYVYGWKPSGSSVKESISTFVDPISKKREYDLTLRCQQTSLLALGWEDCAIISSTEVQPSYFRRFKEAGLVECCLRSYNDRNDNHDICDYNADNESNNDSLISKKDSIVLLSCSTRCVVYSDSSNSLWSFGMDIIEDNLVDKEKNIKETLPAKQEGIKSVLAPIAEASTTKVEDILAAIVTGKAVTKRTGPSTQLTEINSNISATKIPSLYSINQSIVNNSGDYNDRKIDDNKPVSFNESLNIYKNLKHNRLSSRILIKQIAAGDTHCLVLTDNYKLYTFGTGNNGELGIGTRIAFTKILQNVTTNSNTKHSLDKKMDKFQTLDEDIKYIAAGSCYSAMITVTGSLYTFGCGAYYRLGHGTDEDCLSPTRVEALEVILVRCEECT